MDRYEEALERAKAGKPMYEVFPELKESEDERIRKAPTSKRRKSRSPQSGARKMKILLNRQLLLLRI